LPDLSRFARRLVPARPDLAADHLAGSVTAARFAPGEPRRVAADLLDLPLDPDRAAGLATQRLHGEPFTVYETTTDGLAWGQSGRDGYVGYVEAAALGPDGPAGDRITAIASHVYTRPTLKALTLSALPFGAEVAVAEVAGGFARLAGGGFVPAQHLAPMAGDHVVQALRFAGVPYLWGGRSARGIDCSGLVQLALMAAGIAAPRDSDMQAALLGEALDEGAAPARGDLVFWDGHVGLMRDPETLIHANALHMAVAVEPFAPAAARILAAGGGPVTGRRRIDPDR
jgi:cell wall-associated NlpC family hydrolase